MLFKIIVKCLDPIKCVNLVGILDLRLYPYGNARQSRAKDGSWKFTCQHGPKECLGNVLEVDCWVTENHVNVYN